MPLYLESMIAKPEYAPSSLPPKESWGKSIPIKQTARMIIKTGILKRGSEFISFLTKQMKTVVNIDDMRIANKRYNILNWLNHVRISACINKNMTNILAEKKKTVAHFSMRCTRLFPMSIFNIIVANV